MFMSGLKTLSVIVSSNFQLAHMNLRRTLLAITLQHISPTFPAAPGAHIPVFRIPYSPSRVQGFQSRANRTESFDKPQTETENQIQTKIMQSPTQKASICMQPDHQQPTVDSRQWPALLYLHWEKCHGELLQNC